MTTNNIRVINARNGDYVPKEGNTQLPKVINVQYKKTVTTLLRTESNEYTGTPRNPSENQKCRFALVVTLGNSDNKATVEGMAAVNFIANNGWEEGLSKPPPKEQQEAAMRDFLDSFFAALILHGENGDRGLGGLKNYIEAIPGLNVAEGEMTLKDTGILALTDIQIPCHMINVARSNGIRITVDIQEQIKPYVASSYARVTQGQWNKESDGVANTSLLPLQMKQLMCFSGHKFSKVAFKKVISN